MNYLGRQIFPFKIQWTKAIERAIDLDLRSNLIGFGAEYFTPTQTYTVNSWSFTLFLRSGADLLAFEDFCDALIGRANGFWLPCPTQAARFAAAIDTSHFKIVSEGLADTWNTRPDQHLLFTFDDGTQAAGQIAGVVDNGDGTETVTMSAALPQAPAAGVNIQRLHYVRMSSDQESYDFEAENKAMIQLTVAELPLEYTNAETGLQPIYLYHYWMKAPVAVDWYHTSFAAPVVSNGKVFSPWPTSHGEIKQSTDMNANPVDITVKPDETHPLAMFVGMPPGQTLWLQISRCYLAAPDTVKKLFTGFMKAPETGGIEWKAQAVDRLDWLKTKSPTFFFGTNCNYDLYEPHTCKVPRAPFETTVTLYNVVSSQPPVIRVTFDFGFQLANWKKEDWFKGGLLETNLGIQYDLRSIVHSHWNGNQLELTLNAPIRSFNLAAGTQYQIVAGCDHTSQGANGCGPKFNNFLNFGACVVLLDRNLTLKGLNTNVSQGNKKG